MVLLVTLLPAALLQAAGALRAAPARFADSAFQQVWERTDAPVAAGTVQRSWYWGPEPGKSVSEAYSGSSTGNWSSGTGTAPHAAQ